MTEGGAERDRVWLDSLAQLFGFGRRSTDVEPDAEDTSALYRRVEELILGGPRRYTRHELVKGTGYSLEQATRLWRAMGFSEVGDDEAVFTEGDRQAILSLAKLHEAGPISPDVEEAASRATGQAMAGLADWQVEMVYQLVDHRGRGLSSDDLLDVGNRVLPLLELIQTYVWRRHLAAAAGRLPTALLDEAHTQTLTVGFVDLVGFSRATRRLNPAQLTELIEGFQRIASDVVAAYHGRVVKTVGDEVLFVADQPAVGAEIALRLLDRLTEADGLPDVRIGLAEGQVVARFGDVYGEVVNIAARLTAHAQPGAILVDHNLGTSLGGDERFELVRHQWLSVRGYRSLEAWGLRRPMSGPAAPD